MQMKSPGRAPRRLLGRFWVLVGKASRRGLMYLYRPLFAGHGRQFRFDVNGLYTFDKIRVGNSVNLGYNPILLASGSGILIGNNVIFGPEVVLVAGDHNITIPGRFICDGKEKRPEDDVPIIIEDDVWVGARGIVLKGVKVSRGSIIGAGSVVTRDVPPYAVMAGNPARVVRFRWDVGTIMHHEESLYPAEQRLSRAFLEELQRDYQREA